jgi:hypothetical protein
MGKFPKQSLVTNKKKDGYHFFSEVFLKEQRKFLSRDYAGFKSVLETEKND